MSTPAFTYAIVGGGLTGASAVEGIREHDQKGNILLIGSERHLPYDRPPLTKKLWFGQKKVEEIFLHDRRFYEENGVSLVLGEVVVSVDPEKNHRHSRKEAANT
ncbi:MAG: FAD-dependent oxidoreductase [Syntrophales bacterium]